MGFENEVEQSVRRPYRYRLTAGSSGHASSPHPSSREGHHSTTGWISSVLLLRLIVHGSHAATTSRALARRLAVIMHRSFGYPSLGDILNKNNHASGWQSTTIPPLLRKPSVRASKRAKWLILASCMSEPYMAGAGGQTTVIVPSHDLVVVRLGHYKSGAEAKLTIGVFVRPIRIPQCVQAIRVVSPRSAASQGPDRHHRRRRSVARRAGFGNGRATVLRFAQEGARVRSVRSCSFSESACIVDGSRACPLPTPVPAY